MTNATPSRRAGRWTLVALFALFFGPLALAAVWYALAPQLAPAPQVHGTLVEPVQPLEPFSVPLADGEAFTLERLRGRWHLVQFVGPVCESACRRRLHDLRQVHDALGEDRLRLRRIAVTAPDGPSADLETVLGQYPNLRVLARDAEPFSSQFPSPRDSATVFLVDPLGNLMLRFGADVPPEAMLDDLEKLLKLSRIG